MIEDAASVAVRWLMAFATTSLGARSHRACGGVAAMKSEEQVSLIGAVYVTDGRGSA